MAICLGRKCIGLFLPYLGGYYLGSIVEEFRKQCCRRGYDLVTVMTSSKPMEYELPLALDYIDAAYVSVDTLSKNLVRSLIDKGIPVVSATEEYFPLNVDSVTCDQGALIKKAFNHLYQEGHRKIGFVGMLSITDFRLRYESLLRCCRKHNIDFKEDWLIEVNDVGISGGTQAVEAFDTGRIDCTAIICGSDLMAIGLSDALKRRGVEIPKQLAIVGIDNTTLGQQHSPSITTIEQGLPVMVSRSLELMESRWQNSLQGAKTVVVKPELIIRQSSTSNSKPETQPDRQSVAHYMLDNNELAMSAGVLDYRWLADLSNMWGPFFDWMCYGIWEQQDSRNGQDSFDKLHLKDYIQSKHHNRKRPIPNGEFTPGRFPCLEGEDVSQPKLITVLPISAKEHKHSVIAIVDTLREDMDHAAYNMFNYYAVLLTIFQEKSALIALSESREKSVRKLAEHLEVITNSSSDGVWIWDLLTNCIEWNQRSLEMLGYLSEHDQKNYQAMPFLERIHPDDLGVVKQALGESIQETKLFKQKFRMCKKDGEYIWVVATGDLIRDSDSSTRYFVGALNDITESLRSQERIEYLAYHDTLTNLPNRHAITQIVSKKIQIEPPQEFVLCLLDLDRFKVVNDTLGHQYGDKLLIHVASEIRKILHEDEFIARFGGDEFVLLLRHPTDDVTSHIADRIQPALVSPLVWKQKEIRANGSLGIARYPHHGRSMDELFSKADLAMYEAKKKAKGIVLYDDAMEGIYHSFRIESLLKHAIEREEFYIVLQPLFTTDEKNLKGAEVLLRWQSSDIGNVPPSTFIPIAERTGIIIDIGDWVLKRTLKLLKRWKDAGFNKINLSINISNIQLKLPDFAEQTCDCIYTSGVDADQLIIEVTESSEFSDKGMAVDVISKFREFGCKVAFDDFGTGYSSLSLLYNLPVDIVKLDRSFIQDFHLDPKRTAMVGSLISLCQNLDYKVVAEGIECEEEAELLKKINCDYSQGYFHSRPVRVEEFEDEYLNSLAQFTLK